ncbi:TPA: hypothetical protein KDX51_001456 [Vibrio parahaemolyticus]|nr:hypothetical protein [Vibrio parahaemolyticus]
MQTTVTTETLLRGLSRLRLAEIARFYGLALPNKSREEQVGYMLATIDVRFNTLLEQLTREELRRACRAHGLDDTGRSRLALADVLVSSFDGDVDKNDINSLFSTCKTKREGPVPGDVIRLRHRQWLVEDVVSPPEANQLTIVKAVCLDDDNQGELIEVLWEMELGAKVVEQKMGELGRNIDEPRHFAAYLHALKWNSVTATDRNLFQAPFRAGIMLQAHQLEPLRRALSLPRANLFIADDVGLGKTIEAGLVLQELLLRQRVEFIMISCPASVCLQWRDEMFKRFGLQFEVMNRSFFERRRRERGFGVNPWSTHNRFIISHDLLRRPEYREPLLNILGERAKRSLFVLDEAHIAAPSSGGNYATDSNITRVIRDVAPRFENRLFLSATPHNGHSNSFAALLELLDPQRFTRGVPVTDESQRDAVMVRRLKEDLRVLNRGDYPYRKLIRHSLRNDGSSWFTSASDGNTKTSKQCIGAGTPFELQLSTLLSQYSSVRTEIGKGGRLALVNLQKRLLSSVTAFKRTLKKHADSGAGFVALREIELVHTETLEHDDLYGDERDDDSLELDAVIAATANLAKPNVQALKLLNDMLEIAERYEETPDAKILSFLSWVRDNQCPAAGLNTDCNESKAWTDKRVIIFTQSTDTKAYIERQLQRLLAHTDDGRRRVMTFHGGLGDDKRAEIQQAFNSAPEELHELAKDPTPEGQRLKAQRLFDANDATEKVRIIADVCVGAFFSSEKEKARLTERQLREDLLRAWLDGDEEAETNISYWVKEIREQQAPFHWWVEFPEVFYERSSEPLALSNPVGLACMDGFVGNPPFIGGKRISTLFGGIYSNWLSLTPLANKNSDLSAHFFRRSAELCGEHGSFGLIATNTIAQGDTRKMGLQFLVQQGWEICNAIRTLPWPGSATVTVSVVHAAKGRPTLQTTKTLDGDCVDVINSYLRPKPERTDPCSLNVNKSSSYQGVITRGVGFTITEEQKNEFIKLNSSSSSWIKPYIGGDEVNTSPNQMHHRYVIDLNFESIEMANSQPELLNYLRLHVKPERDKAKDAAGYPWWRFWRPRDELYGALSSLNNCLVTSRHQPHLVFSFQPAGRIFSEALYVFPIDTFSAFAVLQSRIHETWVRLLSSSLEDRLRYAASDCFSNFPFPHVDPNSVIEAVEVAGSDLYKARAMFMAQSNQGLTKTYNALNDPECDDERIVELRSLHEAMDRAVLDAYGWTEIEVPPYCPQSLEEQAKVEAFKDEVIDRLYVLNAKRAEEEKLQQVENTVEIKGSSQTPAPKKADQLPNSNLDLFG